VLGPEAIAEWKLARKDGGSSAAGVADGEELAAEFPAAAGFDAGGSAVCTDWNGFAR
jgi:hypothetical protein